jgi:hypothetical protein
MVREADSFTKLCELQKDYDQDSYCWKTYQHSLFGGLETYSEPWPRSGMIRSGIAYRLRPLPVRPTSETGCPGLSSRTGDQQKVLADPESERVQRLRSAGEQVLSPYVRPELPLCEGSGSRQCIWEVEPELGRVVNGVSIGVDRAKRIKALGNAVVPQVTKFIGNWILEVEQSDAP